MKTKPSVGTPVDCDKMTESEQTPPPRDSQGSSWNGKTILVFLAAMFVIHAGFCWWFSYYERSWIRDPQSKTVWSVTFLAQRLEKYRETNDHFPDQLEELFADRENLDYVRIDELSDGWKRLLNYTTDGKKWQITSYGSDGQPGGMGVETDICFDDTMFVKERFRGVSLRESYQTTQPTLKQIFVKEFFHSVLFSCVLLLTYFSVLTFFYWYASRKQATNGAGQWSFGVWLVILMWLNYMVAMLAMIPAARK